MWPATSLNGAPDRWTSRFALGPTATHPRGYSLYRLTSYVFPNNSPEAITVVTVWKRFSDLQKLQRKMRNMHQDLHLKGTCPSFAKWSYFKRFDVEVIEERKKTTLSLLEFIAVHPLLFTSTDFVNFLKSSHPDPNISTQKNPQGEIEKIRNSLLLPVDLMVPLEYQSSEEDSFSTVDSPSVSTMDSVSVNSSVINNDYSMQSVLYQRGNRHTSQNIDSAESSINAGSIDSSKMNDKSVSHQSVADMLNKRLTVNNPMRRVSSDAKQCIDNVSFKSNLPDLILLDGANNMERSQTSINSDDSTYFVNSIPGMSDVEKIASSDCIGTQNQVDSICQRQIDSQIKTLKNNVNISTEIENDQKKINKNEKVCQGLAFNQKNKYENMKLSFNDNNISDVKNNNSTNFMSLESLIRKNVKMESCASQLDIFSTSTDLQENYVFEAGYLLSLGAKNEAKADYETAFDCYKLGIEKLLIGVQGDANEFRRLFVKDKVAKYLTHAEKIYTLHLNSENEDGSIYSKITKSALNTKPIRYIDKGDLCKPYHNLSEYRVLGIVSGQVMLVLHSETQECFAMKVIQKSCNSVSDDEYFNKGHTETLLPTLPRDIPYMVNLKSYIETPNLLFLVLQYASGGKLFEYIHNHSKSVPNTPIREVNLENVFSNLPGFNKSDLASNDQQDIIEYTQKNFQNEKVDLEFELTEQVVEINNSENCVSTYDLSVADLVINSQELLLNVDDALSGNFLKYKKDDATLNNSDLDTKKPCQLDLIEQTFDGLQAKLQIIESSIQSKVPVCALPPKSVCKWGAELLLAIEHLHECGVICWTLHPENILLGDGGHLVLSYFVSRDSQDVLLPFLNTCNTGPLYNLYIAPELQHFPFLKKNEFDENVCDFWSFGAIMYELITGMPLSALHSTGFNSHTILNFPDGLPQESESLLCQLLAVNPRERLGSGPSQIEEIKNHSYFKNINWKTVLEDFNVCNK